MGLRRGPGTVGTGTGHHPARRRLRPLSSPSGRSVRAGIICPHALRRDAPSCLRICVRDRGRPRPGGHPPAGDDLSRNPQVERFLATGELMWMARHRPDAARGPRHPASSMPTRRIPDPAVRLAARFVDPSLARHPVPASRPPQPASDRQGPSSSSTGSRGPARQRPCSTALAASSSAGRSKRTGAVMSTMVPMASGSPGRSCNSQVTREEPAGHLRGGAGLHQSARPCCAVRKLQGRHLRRAA